jgi:arylsulfatase A-like enzyme/Tfp pilus assembly protein PilF
MNRYAVVFCALILWFVSGCGPGVTEPPTHVVLIVVDSLRPDHIGSYGYGSVETPNIDGLGTGIRFENAVSPVPITLPAVASILTSLTPIEHGIHYHEGYRLPDDVTTLAEVLSGEGYRTAAFVGAAVLDPAFGLQQGFDVYDSEFPERFPLFNASLRPLEAIFNGTQRRASEVTLAAAHWLDSNRDDRFFLFLHLYDPHLPCDPPPPFVPEQTSGEYEDFESQQVIQYDAEINYTDHQIGRFLEQLREWGLMENTLVVLTSDHGEGLGDKGEDSHSVFLYDSTVRVPLIFGGATGLRRDQVVTDQVRLIDVYPTILDMLGIAPPEGLSGTSLLPLLEGGTDGSPGPAYLETYASRIERGWSVLKGIRDDGWKYIRAPEPELYNLTEDPGESRNLYGEDREMAERLETVLAEMEKRAETVGRSEPHIPDSSLVEKIRSLGYLGAGAEAPDLSFSSEGGPDPKAVFPAFRNERYTREYIRLALLFLPGGQMAGARFFLEKAIELQPDNPQPHLYLSEVFRQQGLNEKAEEEIDRVLSLEPENADAHYQRGLIVSQLGNADAALEAYERTVSLDPTNEMAFNNLGTIYGMREEFDRAQAMFEKALEINPDLPQSHANLGGVHFARQAYREACEEWEISLRLDPTQKNLHVTLGSTYSMIGEYEKALVHYEDFIAVNPDTFTVQRIRGAMETIREKMAESPASTGEQEER